MTVYALACHPDFLCRDPISSTGRNVSCRQFTIESFPGHWHQQNGAILPTVMLLLPRGSPHSMITLYQGYQSPLSLAEFRKMTKNNPLSDSIVNSLDLKLWTELNSMFPCSNMLSSLPHSYSKDHYPVNFLHMHLHLRTSFLGNLIQGNLWQEWS